MCIRDRAYLDKLQGRVQRLSVGVQSFDDGLLKQMDRYDKYGSGAEILERIGEASPYFTSLNVDMIFNFPAQTEDILINDIERVVESGTSQTTFYPLMASPSVARQLARTVGRVDYTRERTYYEIISELLAGGSDPLFEHGSAWTFNKRGTGAAGEDAMIDEYVVDYEEYPAIGSGGITYLGDNLFVNTFSVNDYNAAIAAGRMSLMEMCIRDSYKAQDKEFHELAPQRAQLLARLDALNASIEELAAQRASLEKLDAPRDQLRRQDVYKRQSRPS